MQYTDEEIIAFLSNDLDELTQARIADWIASSPEAQQRAAQLQQLERALASAQNYDPSPDMLYVFREKLAEAREQESRRRNRYRIAAAVVLMIAGFGAGRYSFAPTQPGGELTDLRGEVRVLQQLVMMNTLKQHTASERLLAISMIEAVQATPDDELITTLARTMNNDENPGVRFAAVQALARYVDRENVRTEMVRSLGDQEDPLVQLALINVLMEAQERAAVAPIRKIAENRAVPAEIRRTAQIALDVLI
jgi:HEAT repeat protein